MKIRIKFSKQGAMKFIGHLDTMRYFQKAMRRADVDIRYSEGFSPHQIMSFAAPLGVGLTGSGEYLDIEVLSTDSSAEMVKRLNDTMVEGVEVLSYRKLPDDAENAMSIVAACDYTIVLRDDYENGLSMTAEEFYNGILDFIENGNLNIVKKTKKGEKEMDLKSDLRGTPRGGRKRTLPAAFFWKCCERKAGAGPRGILQVSGKRISAVRVPHQS